MAGPLQDPQRRPWARLGVAALAALLIPTVACDDDAAGPESGRSEQIYFVRAVSGEGRTALYDVFRMGPDGTGVENVTRDPVGRVMDLRLSPDEGRLALTRDPGGVRNVFVIDRASGEMTQLTDARTGEDFSRANGRVPFWSPDGTMISFRSDREVAGQWDIYVMNADGTDQRRVSTPADTEDWYMNHTAEWSPGGRVGFFHMYHPDPENWRTFAERSYTVGPDGTGLVLFGDGTRHRPAWSPDGSRVAFVRLLENSQAVSVMGVDGTDERMLYEIGAASDTFLVFPYGRRPWSPDGSRLAFELTTDAKHHVHVIGADGTGHRQLTDPVTDGNTSFVAWSPDGTRILFRSEATGVGDLYVIGVDGTGLMNLTASSSDDTEAVWAPGF